ncbi:MAG TPA: glycogen-binding domain-containing protein [Gemmatimonadota bacterium]|nr:glycogen-binding domain-containing protein [Gemmatimonadota bacterium]
MSEIVMRYLDGDVSPGEEADALHRIADDVESRRELRFELRLRELLLKDSSTNRVPDGFHEQVMATLADEERPRRALLRRPAYVYAAAAALAGLLLAGIVYFDPFATVGERLATRGDGPSEAAPPTPPAAVAGAPTEEVWVRFQFTGEASESVAVAGDFSYWEPIPLSEQRVDGRPVWTAIVAVPRGEHRYMFLVDGADWVTDPLAPIVRDDSFGHRNAILSL